MNFSRYRLLLIAVFIIFIINFGEVFGFSVIEATKGSPSGSPNIVAVINVAEEMEVIINRIATCPDKRTFDINRLGNVFTAFNGFFDNIWSTVRGREKLISESFNVSAPFCNGSRISSDIVDGIMKVVGYITTVDNLFWRWVNLFQNHRMHSELGAVSGNESLLDKFSAFFSGISRFFCRYPQQDIANNESSSKKHQEKIEKFCNAPHGFFRLSPFQAVFGFCVGMLAMCFFAVGVYLIDDYGHPVLGWFSISFSIYLGLSLIGFYCNFFLCRWWGWFL